MIKQQQDLTGGICESSRYSHILIALLRVDQAALRAVLKIENVSSNPEATQTRNWFGSFDRQYWSKQKTKNITEVMTNYLVNILKVIWHVYCVDES